MRRGAAYLIVFVFFLACYLVTSPEYIGDTTRYAGDVIGHVEGRATQFWEFGHLLWRPWGYVGYSLFGARFAQSFGDTPAQVVDRFLIQTNFVCSAVTLLVMLFLLRKVAGVWVAGTVVIAMSCAISFLNYSHSGAPYIPALLFSALTLLLVTIAAADPAGGRPYALLAGVSFAIACALWFPYAFTGLGMVAALYLWPSRDSAVIKEKSTLRHQLVGSFLVALAASTLFLFVAGAAAKGIGNVSQLRQWVQESDDDWSQSKTLMRAVTGLPRSVWDLGGDTILLKRWLFSDPYNPVNISKVVFSLGAKLAAFYLGICATLWVLWKDRCTMLGILAAAGLPLLLFAIALFEPSSPERFLPVFPFAYLAFALILDRARRYFIPSACIVILLVGTTVVNLAGNRRISAGPHWKETRERIHALNTSVRPGALVTVVSLGDDLYSLPIANPLDKSLAHPGFRVADAVVVASRTILRWRATYAERAREQWAQDREMWFSERLLAPRPDARWLWVEGDDPRIRWPDLPGAFGQLETDLKVDVGGDGFLRVAPSQANRDQLAKWSAATEDEPAH